MLGKFDFSPTGRARVVLLTALGTLFCIAVAFAVDCYVHGGWGPTPSNNLVIPLLLAPPFFYYLLSKLRELAIAHRELLAIASTDPLTSCLNRRSFQVLVEGYLDHVARHEAMAGALLVLDVDHFKRVNDQFGHDNGDEALKLIATEIKGAIRGVDLVARIGGEEFSVFLPDVDPPGALGIAERIRAAVSAADFRPRDKRYQLAVSIGGATFDRPITFIELYRSADQRLYRAKSSGRNRVILDLSDVPVLPKLVTGTADP